MAFLNSMAVSSYLLNSDDTTLTAESEEELKEQANFDVKEIEKVME